MTAERHRRITITEFLSKKEIERCIALYRQLHDGGTFAATVAKEIITPNLARINAALGQENDPEYLAYAVEYMIMEATIQAGERDTHKPISRRG